MKQRAPFFALLILIFQALSLQFWLAISAHSGQTTIPWMMTQGRTLFGDIFEQHAPATSLLAAAAQMLLPFDVAQVDRLLNTVTILLISICVYVLAFQLSRKSWVALTALATWVLWSPAYANVLFYFNTLLVLFVLLALALWFRGEQKRWWQLLLVGLLMGASTLAKQQGWAAVGFFGLWMLWQRVPFRQLALYSIGAFFLPLLTVAIIAAQGNLEHYLFWNWTFNFSGYMDGVPLDTAFFRKLLLSNIFILPYGLMLLKFPQRANHLLLLLMAGAMAILLYPRAGESAAISLVPLAAIISALVLGKWQEQGLLNWRDERNLGIIGLLFALGIGWLWSGAVAYLPMPFRTFAYEEFAPIVTILQEEKQAGDTLFVLPETDSTPQLHPLSGMLPPQTWIKGWRWYLEPEGILDTLLGEWEAEPPTFFVLFPTLIEGSQPQIDPLTSFVDARYTLVATVPNIYQHGEAQIYRLEAQQ
jgi:hypothetical protein